LRQSYYADPSPDLEDSLCRAVEAANLAVRQQAHATGYEDMGSTVVAVVIYGARLIVANVGDSRAYLWNTRTLHQLSTDHTWVAERLAEGVIGAEEAAHHQLRHVITRSLGQHLTVEPAVQSLTMQPGERLLLCCDGVWEVLPEAVLKQRLERTASPRQIAEGLVSDAREAGSADDMSVIVAVATDSEASPAKSVAALPGVMARWYALSPTGFILGSIAVGILGLAFFGLLLSSLWSGLRPSPPPTPTPGVTEETFIAPSATLPAASETPVDIESLTPIPSFTLAPLAPTSTPVPSLTPAAGRYCILPSTNPQDPRAQARSVNPQTCSKTGGAIPVGKGIEVPPNEVMHPRCPSIRVLYEGNEYFIFPYRIGLRDAGGPCTSLDWRSHFSRPRQE
jgi:serine/threonine protein phosphatase PrpC